MCRMRLKDIGSEMKFEADTNRTSEWNGGFESNI